MAHHPMSDVELLAFLTGRADPYRQTGHRPGRREAPRGAGLVRPRPLDRRRGLPDRGHHLQYGRRHAEGQGPAPRPQGGALRRRRTSALSPLPSSTVWPPSARSSDEVAYWAAHHRRPLHGPGRADEYSRRNGVPGELLVRVRPTNIVALVGLAD